MHPAEREFLFDKGGLGSEFEFAYRPEVGVPCLVDAEGLQCLRLSTKNLPQVDVYQREQD